jgi:poly(3-hydroxybutyrate) depolymerase
VRTSAAENLATVKCWNRKFVAGAVIALAAWGASGSEPGSPLRDLSLRELELDTGVVVEITAAVKIDNDTLLVTLVNGREGKVHRRKLSEREEKRRFGTVVPRIKKEIVPTETKDADGPPVEIALRNGKTISVVRAVRIDDNLLAVKLADGKTGKMKRGQLSERDQLRCFGPPAPPHPNAGEVAVTPSGLPPDFDHNQFVASFTVKPEHLQTGSFKTPFYTMPFRYFVPEGLPTGIRVPMVVFLHGVCEGGTDNLKQLLHRQPLIFVQPWMQEKYPCFFVAPQLNKNGPWCGSSGGNPMNATEELQIVVAIVDELQTRFPSIDPDRIYLTGLSSGGLGVFEALAKYPGKFAGGVPISAGYFRFAQEYFRPQQVAVWAFLNPDERPSLRDDCRASLAKIAANGGTTRETNFSAQSAGGHLAWFWAYAEPNLIPWLFAQRRGIPE